MTDLRAEKSPPGYRISPSFSQYGLAELGVKGHTIEAASGHYQEIYQSSERALAAAGFGSMLRALSIESDK